MSLSSKHVEGVSREKP